MLDAMINNIGYIELYKYANLSLGVIGCLIATRTAAKPTQNIPKPQKRPSPKTAQKAARTATKQQSWRKEGHKGDFAKARSNEKRRGERVDHISNSM